MPSGYTPIDRWLRLMLFGLSVMIMATPATADPRMPPVAATKLENHLGLTFTPCGKQAFWVAWDGKWGSGAGSNQVI